MVREDILDRARHKASRWLSYRVSGAEQLVGQVGGVSKDKRPLLTLDPDYILKPLQLDHRGIRELSFYEAINAASHTSGTSYYVDFVASHREHVTRSWIDWIAFSIASMLQDPYVLECERRALEVWTTLDNEAKLLRRLYRFIPSYFGTVRHEMSENVPDKSPMVPGPYGIHFDCYLLLQDVTCQFQKPCVIDLKMGYRTYEPDAPESKKERERKKYPHQQTFGFRIVGKRIYIPSHKEAEDNGFVFYPKQAGRAFDSLEGLKEAFVIYFGLENVEAPLFHARLKTITNILLKLRSLQHWFRDNKQFCFYASSLLIAYEGDRGGDPDIVTVKMIDFGRVRRQKGGDPGYLKGLTTVASLLEEILTEWNVKAEARANTDAV